MQTRAYIEAQNSKRGLGEGWIWLEHGTIFGAGWGEMMCPQYNPSLSSKMYLTLIFVLMIEWARPCNTVLIEKVIVTWLFKFLALYRTRRLIFELTMSPYPEPHESSPSPLTLERSTIFPSTPMTSKWLVSSLQAFQIKFDINLSSPPCVLYASLFQLSLILQS
jgi:hypothetical protein